MAGAGRGRSGQALVLVSIAVLVLAAILMLALDGGLLYLDRRQMQSAADAAALAGAEKLWLALPQSYTPVHQQAMTTLTQNLPGTAGPSPFTPGSGQSQVDNGSGGPLNIGNGYSVILKATPTTYQVTLFHQHSVQVAPVHGFAPTEQVTVNAKAVNGNLPYAIVLLENVTQYHSNLQLSGTPVGLVLLKNGGTSGAGGVFSNESVDPGTGDIYFGSAGCTAGPGSSGDLWAVWEASADQTRVNSEVFCGQNPPEVRSAAAISDPGYAEPQPPAVSFPSGANVTSGTLYLCPGTYGNVINVASGATAVLLPGVYRVTTNGVTVSGTLRTYDSTKDPVVSPTLNGCTPPASLSDPGVILELVPADDGTFACGKHVFKTIGSASSITLVPSAKYSNISVYIEQMPNWQSVCKQGVLGTNVVRITGGGFYSIKGAIYGSADNMQISGGGAGAGVGQIIGWTLTITGNGNVNETYDPTGLPFLKGLIQ